MVDGGVVPIVVLHAVAHALGVAPRRLRQPDDPPLVVVGLVRERRDHQRAVLDDAGLRVAGGGRRRRVEHEISRRHPLRLRLSSSASVGVELDEHPLRRGEQPFDRAVRELDPRPPRPHRSAHLEARPERLLHPLPFPLLRRRLLRRLLLLRLRPRRLLLRGQLALRRLVPPRLVLSLLGAPPSVVGLLSQPFLLRQPLRLRLRVHRRRHRLVALLRVLHARRRARRRRPAAVLAAAAAAAVPSPAIASSAGSRRRGPTSEGGRRRRCGRRRSTAAAA